MFVSVRLYRYRVEVGKRCNSESWCLVVVLRFSHLVQVKQRICTYHCHDFSKNRNAHEFVICLARSAPEHHFEVVI